MTIINQLLLLKRMDDLIRLKATGTPENFANTLEISVRTLYRNIERLEELGAKIEYDCTGECYYYTEPCKLEIGYKTIDGKDIKGGKSYEKIFTDKKWHWRFLDLFLTTE